MRFPERSVLRTRFRHRAALEARWRRDGGACHTRLMRVYLGSDHAGLELKNHLVEWLKAAGHEPVDCGPHIYDAQDDYPPFCLRAAERTAADPGALGIVIGGSGNGEQIAANKVKGVRAALAWSEETAVAGPPAQQRQRGRRRRPHAHRRRRRRSSSRPSSTPRSPVTSATSAASRCSPAYETTGELPPIPAHHPQQVGPRRRGRSALGDGPATARQGPQEGTAPCPRGTPFTGSPGLRRRVRGHGRPRDQPAGQVRRRRRPPRRRGTHPAEAHGKHLFLGFARRRLGPHPPRPLRQGRLRRRSPRPPPTDTVRLRLANSTAYVDLRGPTTCALITGRREGRDTRPARPRPAAPRRRPGGAPTAGSPAAVRRSPRC